MNFKKLFRGPFIYVILAIAAVWIGSSLITMNGYKAITTDQGLTGHAFLGSAFFPADADGASLIRAFKPLLVGQDPMDRERLNKAMWKRVRTATVRHALQRLAHLVLELLDLQQVAHLVLEELNADAQPLRLELDDCPAGERRARPV